MERQQVRHPQGLEEQDHHREVGSLDLRHGGLQQLGPVAVLRIHPPGLSGAGTTCSATSLVGVSLGDREHLESVHSCGNRWF